MAVSAGQMPLLWGKDPGGIVLGGTCLGDRVLSDRVPVRCFGAGTAGDTSVDCAFVPDAHGSACVDHTGSPAGGGSPDFFWNGMSGGMLALSLLFDRLTGKESLGGGDIKLFFVTGLYLRSIWEVLFFLILSCVLGIGCSLVWRKGKIPFGPAIAAAFFLMLLFGEQLTGWYRGLWLL